MEFVHLHLHTEYSLVNGIVKIPNLMLRLNEFQHKAVAITDIHNLFATVKFYQVALEKNIKPIIGAEITINQAGQNSRLILLAQNQLGYKNLKQLISQSYIKGQKDNIPTIAKTCLNHQNTDGLIALSCAVAGNIGIQIIKNNLAKAEKEAVFWQQLFPDRFYLELTRTDNQHEELVNLESIKLAEKLQLPVVATNNVHFIDPDDFESHEARVCINQGKILSDQRREKNFTKEQYLSDTKTMLEKFKDIPSAIINTVEIAKRCTVNLEFGENYLPDFPIPKQLSEVEYFTQLANQGLRQKLNKIFKTKSKIAANIDKFQARLDLELKVIIEMHFAGYFLIVADFIAWARKNNIPVGPGRGSGAGSLVAFVLGITNIEPIKYELLFERFLNPERLGMPDFDIDFCMDKRDLVIEYVAKKYGSDRVSQIITYSNMNAKGVVRDVGRVLGFPYGLCDAIARLIPFDLKMTLPKALVQSQDLKKRYDTEDEVRDIIDLAIKLEGIKRNVGKHAAGLVISPSDINDFTPIYCEKNGSEIVSQFDKDDVEKIGLIKFDFLGLRTLTVIDWSIANIKDINPESDIDIDAIDFNDPKVYKLLQRGMTIAIFQMESSGLRAMLKKLKPTEFNDIVAAVALYRPGPLEMQMEQTYTKRKHKKEKVTYPHPDLKEVLKPTYGVIVYQEQVMQIAQILAGYSLGAADILRRAMGKKDPEEMAKQRSVFEQGAVDRGVRLGTAKEIFDLMETFAGYGFNKSHSVAYAYISYQTAWLKTYYPAEFMAAVLSSEMGNTNMTVVLINDSKNLDLEVLPPDINQSDYKFRALSKNKIAYGLGAIKGLGEVAINIIVDNRRQQSYENFLDFCNRIDTGKVNKNSIEALIDSGAFDCFGDDTNKPWQVRATLAFNMLDIIQTAEQNQRDINSGQGSLFSEDAVNIQPKSLKTIEPWREDIRLFKERDSLGMFLTGHPFKQHLSDLENFVTHKIAKLNSKLSFVCFAGLVLDKIVKTTKSNKQIVIIILEDDSGKIEVPLFSETYQKFIDVIAKDRILVITGNTQEDKFRGGYRINVKEIFDIETAKSNYAKYLEINYQQQDNINIVQFKEIIAPFKNGKCPIVINYQTKNASAEIYLGNGWNVMVDNSLITKLKQLDWLDSVKIIYRKVDKV